MSDQHLDCYTRVSSKEQTKGHSIKTQIDWGKKVSQKLGLTFRLRDEGGKSSTIGYREVFEDLSDDIERGKVKHLWIYDRSRLFRDETDSSLFRKNYLEKYKVKFYEGELGNFVNFDSLEEKLSYDIVSKLQQYENEKRSHKSKQGKRYLLRKGVENKHYGGTVLFGYKSIEGFLEIDQYESQWVVFIFKSVLQGKTTIEIKNELDRKGVKPRRTKTGLWNLGTIQKMLSNRSYIGEKQFYDKELEEEFKYVIPSIITRSTFLRVRAEMERRLKIKDNNKKHFSLLSEIMVCECGQSIGSIVKEGKRKDGSKYNTRMYYCVSKSRKWKYGEKSQCVNTKSMSMDKTDEFILSHIKDTVSNSILLKEKFKNDVLSQKFDKDKDLSEQQSKLESKCKRLVKRQEQTYNNIILMETDLLQGRNEERVVRGIVKGLQKELEAYNEELIKTEQEIEDLSNEKDWLDWIIKYGEELEVKIKKKDNQKEWLKGIIDKIVVKTEMGEDRDQNIIQVGHSFDILFKLKVVKDKLVYKDENKKNLGYNVKEGKNRFSSSSVNLTKGRGKKKA